MTWERPPKPQGTIKAYRIYANDKPYMEIAGPGDTSKLLTGLTPFEVYTIGIATENTMPPGQSGIGEVVSRRVQTWPTGMNEV